MKTLKAHIASIIIGLYAPFIMSAQSHRFHPVEQTLSNNFVRSIFKDSQGYVWIGTFNGLDRYDAAGVRSYQHENGNDSTLSHNMINTILEDHQQTLWVGTSEGLNYFDRKNDRFHYIVNKPDLQNRHNNACITALAQPDTTALWMGTRGGGVNIYRFAEKRFDFIFPTTSKQLNEASNHITSLQQHNNAMWVGTAKGLFRIDLETLIVTPFNDPLLAEAHISAMVVIGDSLYAASHASLYVITLNPQSEPIDLGTITQLPGAPITVLHPQRHKQELWIGFENGGLGRLHLPSQRLKRFKHQQGLPNGLPENTIWSLLSDETERLWIGTYSKGLWLYDPYYDKFPGFSHNPFDPHSLSHNTVTDFAEFGSDQLLVATDGGGLSLFESHPDEGYRGTVTPEWLKNLPSENLTTLLLSKDQQLWIGTWGSGIEQIDLANKTRKNHLLSPAPGAANNIFSLYNDASGHLWAGTAGQGLFVLKANQSRFQRANEAFPELKVPEDAYVTFLHEEPDKKTLWIGTLYGLFKIQRQNGNVLQKDVYYKGLDSKGLESNSFQCMHQDKAGRIWLGSFDRGLILYHPETDRFEHLHEEQGLAGNLVQGIASDALGRLWISTNKGLSCLHPDSGNIQNYTVADGLFSNAFQGSSVLQRHDGQLLFGTDQGFHLINPLSIPSNPHTHPALITDLFINHQSVDGHNSNMKGLKLLKDNDFTLESDQNTLTLVFTALNYTRPKNNKFRYLMEGWDSNWQETQKTNQVTYHNLPPGKYTFRVKAANNDGLWNESPATLNIQIAPPLWRSWPALILYLLLLTALIYLLFRFRSRRVHPVPAQWSHELRTALSLIKAPSEKLLENPVLTQEIRDELSALRENTEQLQQLCQKLLSDQQPTAAVETAPEHTGQAAKSISKNPGDPSRHEILLIEDNKELLDFLDRELSKQYSIRRCSNGEEGLDLAIQTLPDLIISDVIMPGITGTELCFQLKNDLRTCHIPILLLTARADDQDQAEALLKGADAYVTKPFSMKILLAQVHQLILNRQQLYQTFRQSGYLLPTRKGIEKTDEKFLNQITTIIRAELSNTNLNVEALAEKTELSRTQLYKKVKALTGLSAVEFIREIRLKEAVALMEQGEHNLTEVAYQSGFNSPSYFSRSFKEYYGLSPSELMDKKLRKE